MILFLLAYKAAARLAERHRAAAVRSALTAAQPYFRTLHGIITADQDARAAAAYAELLDAQATTSAGLNGLAPEMADLAGYAPDHTCTAHP
jgi:hypothetical protein